MYGSVLVFMTGESWSPRCTPLASPSQLKLKLKLKLIVFFLFPFSFSDKDAVKAITAGEGKRQTTSATLALKVQLKEYSVEIKILALRKLSRGQCQRGVSTVETVFSQITKDMSGKLWTDSDLEDSERDCPSLGSCANKCFASCTDINKATGEFCRGLMFAMARHRELKNVFSMSTFGTLLCHENLRLLGVIAKLLRSVKEQLKIIRWIYAKIV